MLVTRPAGRDFLPLVAQFASMGQTFPPVAVLALAVPVLGFGTWPIIVALLLYGLLPIVRNTLAGLEGLDDGVMEAARGMGMSRAQVFWQVRLPLALPVVLEGIRITTVQAIGLAAVAALVGAGGLGTFIFQGLGQAAMDLVLLGALPILAMALAADALLGALSRRLSPQENRSHGGAG